MSVKYKAAAGYLSLAQRGNGETASLALSVGNSIDLPAPTKSVIQKVNKRIYKECQNIPFRLVRKVFLLQY